MAAATATVTAATAAGRQPEGLMVAGCVLLAFLWDFVPQAILSTTARNGSAIPVGYFSLQG